MPETLHERIERERKEAHPVPEHIETYRRYARGEHDRVQSADMMRQAAGLTRHHFADNACGKVLALKASRLEFTGYTVDDAEAQKFLDTFYTKNQLADRQYDTHYAMLRDADHAMILGWKANPQDDREARDSAGRVTAHREKWWNGKTGIWVCYGDNREKLYAVKDFEVTMGDPPAKRMRRNVYFPDHIERFIKDGGRWEAWGDVGQNNDWTKRNGEPLGIPVIHFANGSYDDTPYGMSDLAGGVIGLQDHINDVHMDITVASRLLGFPMVTVTGYTEQTDASGKAIPFRFGPGVALKSTSADTKFGVIEPGDMSKLIEVYAMKLRAMASNTHTPEHVISGGQWPSGLALIRAEMPLIANVERLIKTVGPAWVELGHRATEIANSFGRLTQINEEALIEPTFANPERLDDQAQAEAQKIQLEVWALAGTIDDEVLLKKSGLFTDEEIKQLTAERQKRADEQMKMMVGAGAEEFGAGNTGEDDEQ